MKPAGPLGTLACSLLLTTLARGADAELERIEHDYLAQRDAVVRPLLSGFAEKLRTLQAKLTQQRDPRAPTVKAELDRVVQRLSLPPGSEGPALTGTRPGADSTTGRGAAGTVELRGSKAILTGDAVYDEKIAAAVQFKAKGATAVWNLPALKPDRYRIRLDCGCAAGLGAIVQVVLGDQPPRTLTILPTSEAGQATSFNFGEIELPPGPITLKFEMVDAPPRTKGSGGFTLYLVAIQPADPLRPD